MLYLWIKVFHIVSAISWMAGILYLPRLFVYHADCTPRGETSQIFKVMERRLLNGIMNPAAIATVAAGAWLAWRGELWRAEWFHAKVTLVLVLLGFHLFLAHTASLFQRDANTHSSRFYRLINEAPAVLMLGIVSLVIIKPWM